MHAVLATLRGLGATSVLDLGCGEGNLLGSLLSDPAFRTITGVDVSHRALEMARQRLRLDTMPTAQRERITLFQGSLTYRDRRLSGFDAAVAMEVIEHVDPSRLEAFEEVVLGQARPKAVIITTPNVEYNCLFENLPLGEFRHRDHRFECRGPSSVRGPTRRPDAGGTKCVSAISALSTPTTARPPRWESSPDEIDHTRTVPGSAGGAVGIRQVHLRGSALQIHRGGLLGRLPCHGGRRSQRPVCHAGCLQPAELHCVHPAARRTSHRD